MVFAGKIWKLLVAVKDALALIFLLVFFMGLYALLSMRPVPGAVREGALLLQLDGAIVEEPALPDPVAMLLSGEEVPNEYRARDVVRGLRLAARDKRINAVVLDLSDFLGGGLVHLREVGAALDEVRAAKKPVLAYAPVYSDDSMLLAAHASEVWLDPLGMVAVTGPGGNRLYYKGLMDKLKVKAHVFRVGTFKSAVEPYLLDGPSPASQEADRALYGALWSQWTGDVKKARPKADIQKVTQDPATWLKASNGDAAKAAIAAGLVDRIGDKVEFGQRVAELVGADAQDISPGSFAHTSLETWTAASRFAKPGKAIGVITVAGEIVDGDAGPGIAGGDRIARLLDEALNQDFAALVVRIDSPGGSIQASEEIRRAIERYKAKNIPVVVSMANLAASGGYWVSTPASRIFAEPSTITGSIGVFAVIPSFEDTLAELGVSAAGVKTTPLSGQPDPLGGLTPEVSAMIQANIEYDYAHFVGLVAKARGKTPEQVDAIAQGRVWDGGTARQLGLVDEFGNLNAALAYAAKSAGLGRGQWHPEFLGGGESLAGLWQNLSKATRRGRAFSASPSLGDWAAMAAQRQQDHVRGLVAGVERLLGTRGAQAYCLECPVQATQSARRQDADPGLAMRLLRLLAGSGPVEGGG